jgi:acyl-CoA thioesterase FadM
MIYKKFETEMTVRPSEIDYNGHVHQSAYSARISYLFGLSCF